MARRLSVQEEQEIVSYMRDHPEASDRAVSRRFVRSRAIISRLRSRYALDKPQAPASLSGEAGASSSTEAVVDIEAELEKVDQDLLDWWDTLSDEEKDELIR